jgi:hypothetical protein
MNYQTTKVTCCFVQPHLKKSFLNKEILANYCSISHLPFLPKLIVSIYKFRLTEYLPDSILLYSFGAVTSHLILLTDFSSRCAWLHHWCYESSPSHLSHSSRLVCCFWYQWSFFSSSWTSLVYVWLQFYFTIKCKRGSAKFGVKDCNASLWKHAIFGQLPSRNPETDQDEILHRPGCAKNGCNRLAGAAPQVGEIKLQRLSYYICIGLTLP